MPCKDDLAMWRKSLEQIESDIEKLQKQYDAMRPMEASCISPELSKRGILGGQIYELKMRRYDVIGWIEHLEREVKSRES